MATVDQPKPSQPGSPKPDQQPLQPGGPVSSRSNSADPKRPNIQTPKKPEKK